MEYAMGITLSFDYIKDNLLEDVGIDIVNDFSYKFNTDKTLDFSFIIEQGGQKFTGSVSTTWEFNEDQTKLFIYPNDEVDLFLIGAFEVESVSSVATFDIIQLDSEDLTLSTEMESGEDLGSVRVEYSYRH
ncbi:hypothetical protein E1171_05010 [Cytophagales bacterium RKSG123]|nr:hypothetical protein [Xanthovirga aplysinae]